MKQDEHDEINEMLEASHIATPDGDAFINPGTGPVANATEQDAIYNMIAFLQDSPLTGNLLCARVPELDEDGRFGFHVFLGRDCDTRLGPIIVQMPGWELERVRYMGELEQNIWHFPRLYIDGSSWVWKFAILKKRNFIPEEE